MTEDEEIDWVHRDRGILTERDREILMGETGEELKQNAINQRRYNIRNRIENAILDFHLIAEQLPTADIRQIFEPAYEWSRERRRLDEQGRESSHPDLSPFLSSWMSLFEFYSYGMYAGRMDETQILMQGLIEHGIERGYRQYQHENRQTYSEVDTALAVEYGNPVLQSNYLRGRKDELASDPAEIAEQLMRLRSERKIPYGVAQQWFNELVRSPNIE